MRSLYYTLFLTLMMFSSSSFALVAGPSKIAGKVRSFDTETVTVDNKKATYKIPRKYVTEKSLKAGKSIEVLLNNEQLRKIRVTKKKQK